MSLADHWSDRNYLQAGDHEVVVVSHKSVNFNSGNKGVEFLLRGEREQTTKATFVIVDTALWNLAKFAQACGLTREECRSYDPYSIESHAMLHNRRLNVSVVAETKGDKTYHSADDFWALDGSAPPQAATPSVPSDIAATPKGGDDIPF